MATNGHQKAPAYVLDDTDLSIAFPALMRGLTSKEDVQHLISVIRRLISAPQSSQSEIDHTPLLTIFFDELVKARSNLPSNVLATELSLPSDWYLSPWYIAYVQYTGTQDGSPEGDFESLGQMLPYIRNKLGFRNLYLLPIYESSMADGGYDVTDYKVRESLGGEQSFKKFVNKASQLGIRIITDGIYNHTSTQHEWFQNAIDANPKYLHYYVQRNGREKIAEWDNDNGQVICQYRDINGQLTERICHFPEIDRTHGLWVEISAMTYQFYRSFHPFQLDLNLKNLDVLREILQVLAYDMSLGILGKSLNASNYWIEKAGSKDQDSSHDERQALHEFFKFYLKHLNKNSILVPNIKLNSKASLNYSGTSTTINNVQCSSKADGLISYEMQAALRETLYLQNIAPLWRVIFENESNITSTESCKWFNILENHDEIDLGFYPKGQMRRWISDYVQSHNGVNYANSTKACGRLIDGLNDNDSRLSCALTLLYLIPGIPMVYSGTEIGTKSHWSHANQHTAKRKRIFNKLGVYIEENACFDARELHRGPMPKSNFDEKVHTNYVGIQVIRRLNTLCKNIHGWYDAKLKPVMFNDINVFIAVRQCKGKLGEIMSYLCVVNLSAVTKSLVLPLDQVNQAVCSGDKTSYDKEKSASFKNLLDDKNVVIEFDVSSIHLSLDSFGKVIISADETFASELLDREVQSSKSEAEAT